VVSNVSQVILARCLIDLVLSLDPFHLAPLSFLFVAHIFFLASTDLVCQLGVLVGNHDLFLQPLFF
jgi:hypothetical protein